MWEWRLGVINLHLTQQPLLIDGGGLEVDEVGLRDILGRIDVVVDLLIGVLLVGEVLLNGHFELKWSDGCVG